MTTPNTDLTEQIAAAVLPIVEAEVRAAKAEALREAGRDLERGWPNRLGIGLPPRGLRPRRRPRDRYRARVPQAPRHRVRDRRWR